LGPCPGRRLCNGSGFFFSSRRRHTRLQGDWSSDVALPIYVCPRSFPSVTRSPSAMPIGAASSGWIITDGAPSLACEEGVSLKERSEERRVGKERRSGWSKMEYKKKEWGTIMRKHMNALPRS